MKIVPHAWKDMPALIEVAFPAQKISIEAQCERKAGAGQTLTALGSYWKGRKPLVLVRATVLAALLPATDDPETDLEVFDLLMGMDDEAFLHRLKKVSSKDVDEWAGPLRADLLDDTGKWLVRGDERRRLLGQVLGRMPYEKRLDKRSLRPEELPTSAFEQIWPRVNRHLGTSARTLIELVEQLGVKRFGHRPRVADVFCGGGSIPFEAARIGCDVLATDLNPVACMLTWGALHVLGATQEQHAKALEAQRNVAARVDREIVDLGVEHDGQGNRAKAYYYCTEILLDNGWRVPVSQTWLVSAKDNTAARLSPDLEARRFDISVVSNVSDDEVQAARNGTLRKGDVVFTIDGEEQRIPVKTLRGDRRVAHGWRNDLRPWEKTDVRPRLTDRFQERLYCIQWSRPNGDVFFAAPTAHDLAREAQVAELVETQISSWQEEGLVPSMPITPGAKTDEPIRTRGWTHWHHLFAPRQLHMLALYMREARALKVELEAAAEWIMLAAALNRQAKLCRLDVDNGVGRHPKLSDVFTNQALNTLFNFGVRSHQYLMNITCAELPTRPMPAGVRAEVRTQPASEVTSEWDLYVTDPPYADAVLYHEITEFFISWLRNNPPLPFRDWVWDSRRDLAIRGSGEDFRVEMVKAYTALANHMPDNGMQIVMFTHQDAKVWGDMAGIFWAAGLRVTAAWYIATETSSELKKGGYVQGTVILVLRKRTETKKAYKDELVLEVREEVKKQLETMVGLNQQVRARGRSENLFEDADLQMAGYAAALRVLTGYTAIDGIDMTREALRPRTEGERTIVDELIEFAVAIANEELVPDGLDPKVWEKLVGVERFYLRMLDLEAAGLKKLDNYQNFAKAFRVGDWQPLMGSMKPNDAELKSAREFKRAEFGETEFGSSLLRAVLYALYELEAELETDEVMSHLRDNVTGYYSRRADIVAVASYLAGKLERLRDDEAGAARVLRDLVKGERLGA